MKKGRIEIDVMVTEKGTWYIGNYGLMSLVPDTAFSVIAELEISLNEKLKEEKLKNENSSNR